MRSRVPLCLVVVLSLVACQALPSGTTSARRVVAATTAPGTPIVASPSAVTAAKHSPAAPSAGKAPQAAVGSRLLKPKQDFEPLLGSIAIDASYLVSNNSGSLISDGAGSILAAGAASLTADGRLVGKGGAAIAEAGGNLIANNGGGVLSDHGSGIISDNGNGIVSNNAGGLVSNNSGSLTGKSKFRIATTGGTPVYGALLPAAGMQVGLRSLRTGRPVPVGVDAAGTPVYSIYTNLKGGYELYVDPAEKGNVFVDAIVPDSKDARQHYGLIAATGANQANVLDEDSAVVSRLLRNVLIGRLVSFLTQDPNRALCLIGSSGTFSDQAKQITMATLSELHAAAVAAGVNATAEQAIAVRGLGSRCADVILAQLDLPGVMADDGLNTVHTEGGPPPTHALAYITRAIKNSREAATAKLSKAPSYFDAQPYFVKANSCEPTRYTIKKPADFTAFLTDEYLANNSDPALHGASEIFFDLGMPAGITGLAQAADDLNEGLNAMLTALMRALLLDEAGSKTAVLDLIKKFDPAAPVPPELVDQALGREPCQRPPLTGRELDCAASSAALPHP